MSDFRSKERASILNSPNMADAVPGILRAALTGIKTGTETFIWISEEFRYGPVIQCIKRRKIYHIEWHEGGLFHCAEYKALFRDEGMSASLETFFYANARIISRRACLCTGGVNGCFTYCPQEMALTVLNIVRAFTIDALFALIKCQVPRNLDATWDNINSFKNNGRMSAGSKGPPSTKSQASARSKERIPQ